MTPQQIRAFVLAGNALFTLKSLRTGEHFTFKVTAVGDPAKTLTWKVQVLSGPDNTRNYRFIGTIYSTKFVPQYELKRGSAAHGFKWCWLNLDRCGERFEFNHAGRCGRCGRLLTHPDSIQSGIGPECADKMAFEAAGGVDGLMNQLFGG